MDLAFIYCCTARRYQVLSGQGRKSQNLATSLLSRMLQLGDVFICICTSFMVDVLEGSVRKQGSSIKISLKCAYFMSKSSLKRT